MSKRILLLVHKELVPPIEKNLKPNRDSSPWITEYDVAQTLINLNYTVEFCGLLDSIDPLLQKIETFKPQIVFNLLEEFSFNVRNDYKVVALLDLLKIKYSGCGPKGLLLGRDKALCKKILTHHRLGTPPFYTFPKNKKRKLPKHLKFPLIIKCLFEEASYGIAKASVVHSEEKFQERLAYIHNKLDQDAIVEEFIPGKELYVGIIGHKRLTVLPIWELKFSKVQNPETEIYSSQAKWNKNYRDRKGIKSGPADLDKITQERIIKACKKAYQVLELTGHARIDLRLTSEGKIYILEVNPNPNIALDDEFALSALHAQIKYPELIEKLLP
ncbi:MAG: ATP-grasp domain-containing protein [Halobacteriovoraceae bacterium]|nr:ATP-grasp domain-containing protein [Halobacteriovoraceae bacterium]